MTNLDKMFHQRRRANGTGDPPAQARRSAKNDVTHSAGLASPSDPLEVSHALPVRHCGVEARGPRGGRCERSSPPPCRRRPVAPGGCRRAGRRPRAASRANPVASGRRTRCRGRRRRSPAARPRRRGRQRSWRRRRGRLRRRRACGSRRGGVAVADDAEAGRAVVEGPRHLRRGPALRPVCRLYALIVGAKKYDSSRLYFSSPPRNCRKYVDPSFFAPSQKRLRPCS